MIIPGPATQMQTASASKQEHIAREGVDVLMTVRLPVLVIRSSCTLSTSVIARVSRDRHHAEAQI